MNLYKDQLPKPGIQNQLESYIRKLKTTTSFLELYELNQHQNPRSSSPNEVSSLNETSSSRGQELYTNLIEFTTGLDDTARTLSDIYNQESSHFWILQQNIKRLLKYFSLKKRTNIFWTIPIIGGNIYFPLTEDFDGLLNDIDNVVINNVDLVMKKMETTKNYRYEMIVFQVEKMKIELAKFIKDRIPFSSWLMALIRFSKIKGGNIDNLGEVDYDTALKVEKLLIALDKDLSEISTFFKGLKLDLYNHLNDLLVFSEHFKTIKITRKITEREINKIKKHLDKLQNNHRDIFDKILVEEDGLEGDDEPLVGCRVKKKLGGNIIECSS